MGRSPTRVSIESRRGQPWTAAPAGGGLAEYTRGTGDAIGRGCARTSVPKATRQSLATAEASVGWYERCREDDHPEALYARPRVATLPRCSAADGRPP